MSMRHFRTGLVAACLAIVIASTEASAQYRARPGLPPVPQQVAPQRAMPRIQQFPQVTPIQSYNFAPFFYSYGYNVPFYTPYYYNPFFTPSYYMPAPYYPGYFSPPVYYGGYQPLGYGYFYRGW